MIFLLVLVCALFSQCINAQDSIRGIFVGDWGGEVGTGTTPFQIKTAAGMGIVAASIDAQFVIALGDNFYNAGVKSEYDSRFQSTWLNVYTSASLQKPWYVIAGNHDYKGNVTAQIAYTNDNALWTYPTQYHAHTFKSNDGSVTLDLLLIDTMDLAGASSYAEDEPEYFKPLPLQPKVKADSQWTWIEGQLAASTATYILVGGHYPIYSICEHGPDATLNSFLKPLLQQYNAHYINGHDHCLEHFVENNINYITSGLGMECCYSPSNINNPTNPPNALKFSVSAGNRPSQNLVGGFNSLVATKESMIITFYDQDGTPLYTVPPISPRKV